MTGSEEKQFTFDLLLNPDVGSSHMYFQVDSLSSPLQQLSGRGHAASTGLVNQPVGVGGVGRAGRSQRWKPFYLKPPCRRGICGVT